MGGIATQYLLFHFFSVVAHQMNSDESFVARKSAIESVEGTSDTGSGASGLRDKNDISIVARAAYASTVKVPKQ